MVKRVFGVIGEIREDRLYIYSVKLPVRYGFSSREGQYLPKKDGTRYSVEGVTDRERTFGREE